MSGGSNQRTLFQTWGGSRPQSKVVQPKKESKKAAGRHGTNSINSSQVARTSRPPNPLWPEIGQGSPSREEQAPDFEDDDDDLILVAVHEAEKSLKEDTNSFQHDHPVGSESSSTLSSGQTYADLPGFDSSSAKVWIYPTNYPLREYQLKISEAALFQNTLVCLPTGLGKTFIASVVMYNFYRWYPSGKIVFMAPTKPLVAQQIEACYNVMGIPQIHMAELTGTTAAKQRQEVWRSKRIFFLTPQIMVNDLSRETCPAQQVKCVVIDEAHKALGNHAYCQVVRQLGSQNVQFRILALSATPGGDTKSVQSVISNLFISHIELRSDDSPDIRAHSHQRNMDKVVVPLGETLSVYQACYLQVLEKFMSRLVQNRVMAHKDLRTLSKYQLILARDQFRKNPPPHIKGPHQGMLEGDFALCISLYHGYELLIQMGLRSLFFYFQGIMDGSREMSRARNELQRTPNFMELYHEMEAMFVKPSAGPDEPFIYSHPKLTKLEEVVLQHFRSSDETSSNSDGQREVGTRVMIFSSFRESVQEIATMLNRHGPLIKVMTFMGQASAGKAVKGFTQREQLEVVHRFRQGGFNTLVSTCVGEEGLDIGEVDLIVCFDAQKNPTRLVQRMGRTGRKRQGRVVIILAEGREERTYNQSQSNKRSVYKSIIGNKSVFHLYPKSPRMLPEGVKPTLHKMHITCGEFNHGESSRQSFRGRRSHTEGLTSLIHPHNLIQQKSSTSDGFLDVNEYSLWASTMKLQEDEAHPVFRLSHFMSLPTDAPPQENLSKNQRPVSRELSLSEWRHWQHKALPTHMVDHSLRCHHFIKVMELIDSMKEENEGECRYEQELLPYLQDTDSPKKNRQKKQKALKARTKTDNDKAERPLAGTIPGLSAPYMMEAPNVTNHPTPEKINSQFSNAGCLKEEADACEECFIINEGVTEAEPNANEPGNSDKISLLQNEEDDGFELQAMFYLPITDSPASSLSSAEVHPGREESLKVILDNVAELLSRSPPSTIEELESNMAAPSLTSPQKPHQPFQVSFTLDVDDDDDEVVMISHTDDASLKMDSEKPPVDGDCPVLVQQQSSSMKADSLSWDEVFMGDAIDNHDTDDNCKETDDEILNQEWADTEMSKGETMTEEEEECWDNTGNEEMPVLTGVGVKHDMDLETDNSMDLFEDDEAFLQMTIPDISTPGVTPRVSPSTTDTVNSVKKFDPLTSHTTINSFRPLHTAEITHRLNTGHKDHLAVDPMPKNFGGNTETKQSMTPVDLDTDKLLTMCKSSREQRNSESFESSHDYFSVNFNLGYSLEDSEEEQEEDFPAPSKTSSPSPKKQAACNSSSPYNSSHCAMTPAQENESELSTPQKHRMREMSSPLAGCLMPQNGAPLSPVTSLGARQQLSPGQARHRTPTLPSGFRRKRQEEVEKNSCQRRICESNSPPHPVNLTSDEDEFVVHKKRHHHKVNPLSSPEVIASDVDSPLVVNRKRLSALDTSNEIEEGAVSDDDFQNESVFMWRTAAAERHQVHKRVHQNTVRQKGRQFLDEEAELSEEDAGVDLSSDEEDGEELNRSLEGFVVDNTHCTQGLNDSEMHGLYLKSVRSPAIHGKFKMSYRTSHNMDIFSQVPEMDEVYAEDSFVVGSEVDEPENSGEENEDIELMPDVSSVDGKRQYATRRRVFLHRAREKLSTGSETTAEVSAEQKTRVKNKRGRIIRVNDSSEDETDEVPKKISRAPGDGVAAPLWPGAVHTEPNLPLKMQKPSSSSPAVAFQVPRLNKAEKYSVTEVQQKERCRQAVENLHSLSDELDFEKSGLLLTSGIQPQALPTTSSESLRSVVPDPSVSEPLAHPGPVRILADSRCISSGVELMTSLRQRHAATVQICSLDSSYFIISSRMAVERHSQSELAQTQNRKRLAERVKSLQSLFDRVCLIVEKDRLKPGEVMRPFQRTRYYDCTLVALVRTGVRLLWSDGAEESAGLLADLARLEQRKGQGITVPLEVKGQHKQQTVQLYLSIPSVNYVHALSMDHNFSSIGQLINSSVEAIQKGGCMSRSRAETVYRFLRHSCDSFLFNTSKAAKTS
ncbi:Fanconi anemia group M protein [Antennarius striatus]|uniref:Fanconi anemia group M protein n=1 Tax=Antennarius striatus TaxID=241820 RepID=UPI0035B204EA